MKSVYKKFLSITISILFSISILFFPSADHVFAQSITVKDMVTYSKQSKFIKEFEIPIKEIGLKGITIDSQDNVWFYHSTNKTSMIIKLEPQKEQFTSYHIEGETSVDIPIINLAGGQLVFDNTRNILWFTDARTNSIGKLDTQSGKLELISIPTPKAGPMGIALSPDDQSVWFAEIIGNKIGKLGIESGVITEYFTGEETGPTLMTFDNNGILWITLSYSNNLLRAQPGLLGSIISSGMSTITLPKPDTFSPFGVAVVDKNDTQKIFVSDHSSSRVISSDIDSNLQSYVSYWTSPSTIYPSTLPSQIVADKLGNIYFPQHGGNRISKISTESEIMTEYDIPTGPLSTAVFVAVSDDGKKIWFTEWASNKIAYVDMIIPVPFNLQVKNNQVKLDESEPRALDVILEADNSSKLVSLDQVGVAVIGMTDSGLKGVTYAAQPQWLNLKQNSSLESKISLNTENNAKSGGYTVMVRASASERDQLLISKLYPIQLTLDVSEATLQTDLVQEVQGEKSSETLLLNEITKFLAILVAVGLIILLVHDRIKRSKEKAKQKS